MFVMFLTILLFMLMFFLMGILMTFITILSSGCNSTSHGVTALCPALYQLQVGPAGGSSDLCTCPTGSTINPINATCSGNGGGWQSSIYLTEFCNDTDGITVGGITLLIGAAVMAAALLGMYSCSIASLSSLSTQFKDASKREEQMPLTAGDSNVRYEALTDAP